jgi:L-iditol 2-dehydrogenase
MKALVWEGPRQMALHTQHPPEIADGEVLLTIGAVGICGSELGGYLGHNSLRVPPLVMGHEAAGVVAAVASGALLADGAAAQVGQRVTFNPLITCETCEYCARGRENLCPNRKLIGAHRSGAFADQVALPAKQCYVIPDSMSLVAASLAEPLACAVRAVRTAGVGPGDTLAVLGAGPIGLFCLLAAHEFGVKTIVISDVDGKRLELAEAWGATLAVNAKNADIAKSVRAASNPFGAHAVIDAVGSDITRAQALQTVAPGGRVVLIGLHAESSPVAANYVVRQEITVTGTFGYVRDDFTTALRMLADNRVAVAPDWLSERPLAAGRDSFEELVDGRSPFAKIVLLP